MIQEQYQNLLHRILLVYVFFYQFTTLIAITSARET